MPHWPVFLPLMVSPDVFSLAIAYAREKLRGLRAPNGLYGATILIIEGTSF